MKLFSGNADFSQLLARAAVFLLGSVAAGWLAPETAAIALVVVTLMAGLFWSRVRWRSLLVFAGGLVGLAARHSGGSMNEFHSNLTHLATLVVVMIGLGVMVRGAARSRRSRS